MVESPRHRGLGQGSPSASPNAAHKIDLSIRVFSNRSSCQPHPRRDTTQCPGPGVVWRNAADARKGNIMAKNKQPSDSAESFERALASSESVKYILKLYIVGDTAKSRRAIANLVDECEKHLKGRYSLE